MTLRYALLRKEQQHVSRKDDIYRTVCVHNPTSGVMNSFIMQCFEGYLPHSDVGLREQCHCTVISKLLALIMAALESKEKCQQTFTRLPKI